MLKEESVPESEWYNLFNAKQMTPATGQDITNAQLMGHPSLTPWLMARSESGVFRYERNPYYFKVDVEGSQLPYIDEIRSQVVQSQETLTSRALFGEFDYLGERASLRQLSLIAEKAEAGEVKMLISRMQRLPIAFSLNFAYPDESWRQVVQDVRFRRALNMAINREEIINQFYLGEFARLPEETSPAVHDVQQAAQLLDDVGLDVRDGDGFRLGLDGERFHIPFDVVDQSVDHIPMSELIAEYWNGVGIYTTVRQVDGTVYGERSAGNKIKASAGWLAHDQWRYATNDDYLPKWWAPAWYQWYETQGQGGEEPVPEAQELFELHSRFIGSTFGSPDYDDAYEAIVSNHYENIWTFNPVEHYYYPTFWTNRVGNVPQGGKADVFGIVVMFSMEQWTISDSG